MSNVIHLPVDRTIRAHARQAAIETVEKFYGDLASDVATERKANQEAFKGVLERLSKIEDRIQRLEEQHARHFRKGIGGVPF